MDVSLTVKKIFTKEFLIPTTFTVRATTTVNGTLATAFDNASAIDGVTLATNDIILVKNQTTQSENGVYIVQASGAPVRHGNYDTFEELNTAAIFVTEGTTNSGTVWFQNNVLTSLSDNQSWSKTPNAQLWTVPDNIDPDSFEIEGCGGGGGAGAGGGGTAPSGAGGQGGGGGAGCPPIKVKVRPVPGDVLSTIVGTGGRGGNGVSAADGNSGIDGISTVITGTDIDVLFPGGVAGDGGGVNTSLSDFGVGGTDFILPYGLYKASPGGNGGNGNPGIAGVQGGANPVSNTRAAGGTGAGTNASSGGGGGGSGYGPGGAGGNAATTGNPGADATEYGGGGGGGAGSDGGANRAGGKGGNGFHGRVIFKWSYLI